jgi:hypothetical protein
MFSKYPEALYLGRVSGLTDSQLESLTKGPGYRSLGFYDSFDLTDAQAEILSKSGGGVGLMGVGSLTDAQAEILSKGSGDLSLNSLTSLTDAQAESLSKNPGTLMLGALRSLTDAQAESLSKKPGSLILDSLPSLTDAQVKSLSKMSGDLSLDGLTSLTDAQAESFSKKPDTGTLSLMGLTSLTDAQVKSLSKKPAQGAGPGSLWFSGDVRQRILEAKEAQQAEQKNTPKPQEEAKNEAQAQEAEKKPDATPDMPKPSDIGTKPMLSEAAKTALDDIKTNRDLLTRATFASDAMVAKDGLSRGLNDLSKEGFTINTDSISDILSAAEDQILEIRNNQLAQLENFYDNNIVPVLGDLAIPDNAIPNNPPPQPIEDPFAGMNPRQRMLAMREAEYKASQKAKRESFRSRTGRDIETGRIGGEKIPLTDEQKASNKRRAEIRATKEALGAKSGWIYDEKTQEWKDALTDEEADRLASARVEFEKSLSPEQIKNRKRAERMASMSRGGGGFYSDTEENRRSGIVNKPYGSPAAAAEAVAEMSPEQKAKREEIEKTSLVNIDPNNRTPEQIEKLDILRIPAEDRTPEQIAKLEELRLERSKLIYASKGQLINYQPRGTDTVPAMLTPGEFVVNRKATRNNLDLLKSINSNNYNTGGIVNPLYLQNGTSSSGSSSSPVSLNGVSIPLDTGSFDSGVDKFGSSIDQLTGAINQFVSGGSSIANALAGFSNVANAFTTLSTVSSLLSGTASGLTSAISQFNSSVTRMSESLSSIPDTISLNITGAIPVNVTVTVNGGEGLDEKLSSFEDAIYNEIASEMARATAGKNQIKLNFSTTRK